MTPLIYFTESTLSLSKNFDPDWITENKVRANVLILGGEYVNMGAFPRVRLIYRFGVGAENIPAFPHSQIVFPSREARNILYDSVAEFTAYMVLRGFYESYPCEDWKRNPRPLLKDIKVLIIGQGEIGWRVTKKLQEIATVTTYDIFQNKDSELYGLISNADIISLHIPLEKTNYHFIDEQKLLWMKNNVVLINTARGDLVDEDALYDTMNARCGNMKCYFDVFWEEPYTGKMTEMKEFFMTPHIAGYTQAFIDKCCDDIREMVKQ